MKKIFFAVAAAAVVLLGFTGCGETVQKDAIASAFAHYGASGSGSAAFDAVSFKCKIEDAFTAEFVKEGAILSSQGTVFFKAMSSEKELKNKVTAAAKRADQAVKTQYGDGTTMNVPNYFTSLSITVSYDWDGEHEVATYTYK